MLKASLIIVSAGCMAACICMHGLLELKIIIHSVQDLKLDVKVQTI